MSKRDLADIGTKIRRSPGIAYQKLLDADSRPVPAHLRIDTAAFLGDHDIPIERYIDPRYHELEKEKLWPRVWQMALREERIPEVGDADVYEINDVSILIVRVREGSGPDAIKGYYNACLHMGRNLVERPCNLAEIRCPYHGFTWRTDGKLKHIPGMWDFPHVDARNMSLPEVKVATWNGFVFVNMDPDCETLESYLGEVYRHWDAYPLSDRYTSAHVKKVIRCNWKTGQEAFMDAFHLVASHPQILAAAGDDNTQYDVFGHCSRAITPAGTPSPHLNWAPSEQEIAANVYKPRDSTGGITVPEGVTYREYGAQVGRDELRKTIGGKADALCDAEIIGFILLYALPELPSLPLLQPGASAFPAPRRPPRHVHHGSHVPDAVQGRPPAAGESNLPRPRPVLPRCPGTRRRRRPYRAGRMEPRKGPARHAYLAAQQGRADNGGLPSHPGAALP